MGVHEIGDIMYWHALPQGWESMDYPQFLAERRKLIAQVIRDAYASLSGGLTGEQLMDDADLLGKSRCYREPPRRKP